MNNENLKKIIKMDVIRTNQSLELFKTQFIIDTIFNVLYLWSIKNAEISYKQGMNEIAGILILSMYRYYNNSYYNEVEDNSSINNNIYDIKEIFNTIFDIKYFEADIYIMFDALMSKGLADLYNIPEDNKPKNFSPIEKVRIKIYLFLIKRRKSYSI